MFQKVSQRGRVRRGDFQIFEYNNMYDVIFYMKNVNATGITQEAGPMF